MDKKKKKKQKFSPIISMLILIILITIGSSILSLFDINSNNTEIVNGMLETSIVPIKNVLSKDGIINFFSNIIINFSLIEPFILIILSLMSVSVAKNSGLLKHLFEPLKKIKFPILLAIIIFISIISTIVGDYSYIILLPFVAVLYQYLGKNPVLGLLTVFLGISLGYGAGIFYNYNDLLLGSLTEAAAVIDVDETYKFSLSSNLYILTLSSFIITYLLTLLIDKYLSRKITVNRAYEDDYETSKKAMIYSQAIFVVLILIVISLILPSFGGLLLDNTGDLFIAKLFSNVSPFNQSFMFMFLIVIIITSLVYGIVSKNFKNSHDFSFALSKEFDNIGYLFVLLFLYSILIGIINYSNIGIVFANKLVSLLSVLEFTGIPLIVTTFIFIILMSLLLPNSLEKWSLISPILIPLFMRANISPDFTQFVFLGADSVGKVLTPVFIYFIIMLGLIEKYNTKENKIGLYGTLKISFPIIVSVMILWLLIMIIWYVSGLPLGIGTYAAM